MHLRKILRALGKTPKGKVKLREILFKQRYRLAERELQLLEYTYLEKLSVENIVEKLSLSNSHYFNLINMALSKLEALIDDATMREIVDLM